MVRTSQRYVPIALFVVAAALLAARLIVPRVTKPAGGAKGLVRWVTPEEGMALARSSNKPVLFDFTADWCQPCHQLDAEVFQQAAVASAINERFIPVRVVDRQQEDGTNSPVVQALQQRYSVRGFPTVVIADASGERARMEGFRGRAEFERMMERVR